MTKTVAKKLKYYLDVQRREDGFDLSGPCHPREDPIPLRAGPTLDYDGIHDRSLKHYFHSPKIRRQLQNMYTVKDQDSREGTVRNFMDQTMASVDYRLKPGPISPYALPQTVPPQPPPHRPHATMSVDQYMKTKRGAKRRKIPPNVVGRPRRIARRSPPQHVSRDERERLVDMATKLIVATETVALPATKKQSKGFQASDKEIPRLKREKQRRAATESFSSDSETSQRISRRPSPPKAKPRSAPPRRPESSFFKSSPTGRDGKKLTRSGVHVVLPGGSQSDDDDERLRSLVGRMNLDGQGSSVMVSHHQPKDLRPKSAGLPLKSQAVGPDEESYDDDEFESVGSPKLSSTRTPRMSWMETEHDMIDMSTQTVVHSGTQTAKQTDDDDDQVERQIILPPRLTPIVRDSSEEVKEVSVSTVTATQGASTADIPTSTPLSAETQTRNRDLEPKVLTYEVYVLTGDKLGAGTKATVKLTIFGEYGNSGERQLLRSRTHRTKFQRGQVDIFVIDSVFLGKLSSIRIGHSETKLGYGWFLDKVLIKEGTEATRAFEFRCSRWLSSRDDDGQIIRDLPTSDVIPASHLVAVLPRIDERQDDGFYRSASESDSFSSGEDEDGVPAPDLREVKKKSKSKADSLREKPPISSKRAKPPIPVQSANGDENAYGRFVAVKAGDLFDVSEGEEEEEGENPEGQDEENEDEKERFFQPEEENEDSDDEDAKENSRKNSKRQRSKGDENASESEEEEKEEVGKDDEKRRLSKNGSDQLRLVTTSVSKFKKKSKKEDASPEIGLEEEEEEQSGENEETEEKENAVNEEEDTAEKRDEEVKDEGEDKDEDEDEPRVEFAGDAKPEHERDRPVSAQSEDFAEGFRAGVRAKQEKEREQHRHSISESENILRRGASIHDASKEGKLERVKELIRVVPAMKNMTDERGLNPLHIAAANGRLDCVKWLAVSGVDLGAETPTGYTAMHLAAMNGHVNCMMILSAMGSTLSCRTVDELTPLHLACMSGFVECVKWLIANRAKVDVVDNNGRTPLDIAEDYGHEEIVKLLKKFQNELTRQDSTLAQLMTSEHKRRKSMESVGSDQDGGAPSKVSDSGVGGLESGEDSWISDTEEDLTVEGGKENRSESASRNRPGSGTERPTSASRARTDSMTTMEDKKKNFEKQKVKMQKRNSSFLDSIRMEVDNEEEF